MAGLPKFSRALLFNAITFLLTATVLFLFYFHANEFFNSPWDLKENCLSSQSKTVTEDRVRASAGIWPLLFIPVGMAHTGLRPKGVSFLGLRCIKGYGFHSLKYIKGLANLSSGSALKGPKGLTDDNIKSRNRFIVVIDSYLKGSAFTAV